MKFFSTFQKEVNPRTIKIIFYLLCVLFLPFNFFVHPSSGSDPSWQIALNIAVETKMTWGTDFIFTYGPLGFFVTTLAGNGNKILIVIFELFLWMNIVLVLYRLYQHEKFRHFRRIEVLAIFVLLLCVRFYLYVYLTTVMVAIVSFYIFYSIQQKKSVYFILAAFIAALMLFIKIDTGIVINFVLAISLFYIIFNRSFKLLELIPAVIVYSLAIWSVCHFYSINFGRYLSSTFFVISSYNDAMAINPGIFVLVLALIVCVAFAWYVLGNYKKILANGFACMVVILYSIILFFEFKHGMVRHQGAFFLFPPFSFVIFYFVTFFSKIKMPVFPLKNVFTALLLLITLVKVSISIFESIDSNNTVLFPLKLKLEDFVSKKILHKTRVPSEDKFKGEGIPVASTVPDTILKKIGTQSVDIMPSEVSIAYFNNLRYNPRPGIQTYTVYNEFLDTLDMRKYLSATAPDIVFYRIDSTANGGSVDGRYPFFGEPRTMKALIEHYSIMDGYNNYWVMKRDAIQQRKFSSIATTTKTVKLNEEFNIDQTSDSVLQYTKVKLKYTALGNAIKLLYQPPKVTVAFTLSDGRKVQYRAIKSIMEEGVLLNKYIITKQDFYNLINRGGRDNVTIRSVQFSAPGWAYADNIELVTDHQLLTP